MKATPEDHRWMEQALALAARGLYSTDPNPRVGCVLVREGVTVGEGWHERAGGPHAEVNALRAAGDAARGATAYLNLEPCAHHGRTGPCADALVEAGVTRLGAAGIEVQHGVCEADAIALNRGFFKRHQHGRPWFTVKSAASIDGRTALANGDSRWITGEAAREEVHHLRARASAVMTGIGTVLADAPRLTVRLPGEWRQPARVVLDPKLRCPADARLFDEGGPVFIITARDDAARVRALSGAGATVVRLPAQRDGRADLGAVAGWLADQHFNEVLVEAGATLNGALLDAGLIDEFVLYLAPVLLGSGARALFAMPPLAGMGARRELEVMDVRAVGDDWRLTARLR